MLLLSAALVASATRAMAREIPVVKHVITNDFEEVDGIAVADIDGDGFNDVVGISWVDGVVWWENSNGDGSVWMSRSIHSNSWTTSYVNLETADVDGDGDTDVVASIDGIEASGGTSSDIYWWENLDGAGQDWTQRTIDSNYVASAIAVCDLDGDGDNDVLGAANTGFGYSVTYAWWENLSGDATSWLRHDWDYETSSAFGRSVAASDIDGDGDLDFACSRDNFSYWWENVGGGATQWMSHTVPVAGARVVCTPDLDRDGDLDILGVGDGANDGGFYVKWWKNSSGDGSTWPGGTKDTAMGTVSGVDYGDMDGDGDPDIVLAAAASNSVIWWANDNGLGSSWSRYTVDDVLVGADRVVVADMDADGDTDILASSSVADTIVWYENKTLHARQYFTDAPQLKQSYDSPRSVVSADMDGDGDPDLLLASYYGNTVDWWENVGGLGDTYVTHRVADGLSTPTMARAADIDGDGDQDVVASVYNSNEIVWWENVDGTGTVWSAHTVADTFSKARAVDIADVDGDGDLDLLGASEAKDDIAWWENSASGTVWTVHLIGGSFDGAYGVDGADIDRDGDIDVVGAARFDNAVTWWENKGGLGLSWTEHTLGTNVASAREAQAIDMDGDGDVDVVGVGNSDDQKVRWWENTDGVAGAWSERSLTHHLMQGALHLHASDLNRDGSVDLLMAAHVDNRLCWFMNFWGKDWTTYLKTYFSAAVPGIAWIHTDDMDRDGDVDVIAAGMNADAVYYWENRGGQFVLDTVDVTDGPIPNDERRAVFSVWHRCLSSIFEEGAVELVTMDLLVASIDGVPFSSAEANAVIDSLQVYRDTGDETFDPATDIPVALVDTLSLSNGVQVVTFSDGDTNVTSEAHTGEDARLLFVVAELTEGASVQVPRDFAITHVTESSSSAEDAASDIPLTMRFIENVSASVVVVPSSVVPVANPAAPALYTTAADIDRDGDQDILTIENGSYRIHWWENPTWVSHVVYTSQPVTVAQNLAVADLDGDGDPDILGAAFATNVWWENADGDGLTWNRHALPGAGGVLQGQPLHAADMDRDGDLDVVHADASRVLWLENATGQADSWVVHHTAGSISFLPRDSLPTDVDGDGDVDIVTCQSWNSSAPGAPLIAWMENASSSGAVWTVHTIALDADDNSPGVRIGDLDGDGDIDVLQARDDSGSVRWWRNVNGDGSAWSVHVITADAPYEFPSVGDVDLDGDLDILGAGHVGATWWENVGGSGLTWKACGKLTEASVMSSSTVDMDGDGDVDVLASFSGQGSIGWVANAQIHRSVSFPVRDGIRTAFNTALDVEVVDLDRDGDLDVVGVAYTDDDVMVWLNNDESGTSWSEIVVDGDFDGAWDVCSVDVDRDGNMDLLGAAKDAGDIVWWKNGGDGTSWTRNDIDTSFFTASSVASADVDGNGSPDVLGCSLSTYGVVWWSNSAGDGTAWTKHAVDSGFTLASCLLPADIDRDGEVDVLAAGRSSGDIVWWRNADGSGTNWAKRTIDPSFASAEWVSIADLDQDGDLDVLGASDGADDAVWWENVNGSGTSWAKHLIDEDFSNASILKAADLDSDGDLDLIGAGAVLAWWENVDGTQTNWNRHMPHAGGGCKGVSVGDIDGDGALDLVGAHSYANQVTWWRNRGGHFSLATAGTAPAAMYQGTSDAVLDILMVHEGRSSDRQEEFAVIELLFEEEPFDPLTSTEANAIIARLKVYADDGDGLFDSSGDDLVETLETLTLDPAGMEEIRLPDLETSVRVRQGVPRRYFVVAECTADANEKTPHSFRVTHVTEASSKAEDRTTDARLRLEYAANTATEIVVLISSTSDEDGDGMPDHWEFDHFGHPTSALPSGNADSDSMKNSDEWYADTDPNDESSFFHIISLNESASMDVEVSCTTSRVYGLEWCSNLLESGWTPVPGMSNQPGHPGGSMLMTDTNSTPPVYYRATVDVP